MPKDEGIIKRGNTYSIRYELPPGPDGKRHQKTESCPGLNKQQAIELRRRRLSEIHHGTYVTQMDTTVGEYLLYWLDIIQPRNIVITTTDTYRSYIEIQINPRIGNMQLAKLKPIHLIQLYNELRESGGKRGQPLSDKTIRNIHGLLHAAIDRAVKLGFLAANPADRVDAPRVERREAKATDPDGVSRLLAVIADSPYRIPILIALATGMRRGEALGLRWEDFDSERRVLIVRRSYVRTRGSAILKDTKSNRAYAVTCPTWLVEELVEHREVNGGEWICGMNYTPSALTNGFAKLAEKAGVDITFHGLRHTQATYLLSQGVPLKVVQARLNHATGAITLDRYGHYLPGMDAGAVEAVERLIPQLRDRYVIKGEEDP